MPLPPDFIHDLTAAIDGEFRNDLTTRLLYSTDASNYQIEPLGVVFPRSADDLGACVALAHQYRVPILPRGAGSSLAGQAIGAALILDTSRYLTRIIEIDAEQRTAVVEPGVVLNTLNRAAARFGLTFGPDPASAERATIGGSLANNATGAHSILYGMAADHVVETDIFLADGSPARFGRLSLAQAQEKAAPQAHASNHHAIETELYRFALEVRTQHAGAIQEKWPRVWRRSSGYNLNYLLPWSASAPPQWPGNDRHAAAVYPPLPADHLNLAQLFAGSEGTLGIFKQITLNLVPRLQHTVLGVIEFDSIAAACDATPELLPRQPTAIELIPGDLIRLARSVPAYARQLSFVEGNPAALLVVEFSGADPVELRKQAQRLGSNAVIAETPLQQKQVWDVRKMGLGILNSRPGDAKPISFIEDLAVPVEKLGEFVRQTEEVFKAHGTTANYYAHASAGCLHIRPLINLKNPAEVRAMRIIAEQCVDLALRLGGAADGEHGDGIARSEWIERAFGSQITALFRRLKQTADPNGILNPGKIIDPPPMDRQLRYGEGYKTQPWQTALDFGRAGGLDGAIEMCNGAGVCRKDDGVMCPSFQATREELYSTRGRANLLRAMLSGKFPSQNLAQQTVAQTLDVCLACKGCQSECPSAVDMARLKYEFYDYYYRTHRRNLRDYLFGYINQLAPLGSPFAGMLNFLLKQPAIQALAERTVGLSRKRAFPAFASPAQVWRMTWRRPLPSPDVLLLSDTFSRYFHPETEIAALRALEAAGLRVNVLPVIGAGRTLISKGFLEAARRHASRLVSAIYKIDAQGALPVVGIEPSEIYSLSDEYQDLLPGDVRVKALARRSLLIDEFMIRPWKGGQPPVVRLAETGKSANGQQVLLHGHCYQKARPPAEDGYPVGVPASVAMLKAAGYQVEVIESGCCGMAGAFGYEAEHYELSMQVGNLALFPAIKSAGAGVIIAAAGTSCRSQILDGAGTHARHPICLVAPGLSQ